MTDGSSRTNENQPIYPRPSCKTMPRRNASVSQRTWKPMLRQSACASRPPAPLVVDRAWPGQGGGLSPGPIIARLPLTDMTDGSSRTMHNENQPIYPRPSCKTMPRRNASVSQRTWKPMLRQSACASRPPALLLMTSRSSGAPTHAFRSSRPIIG
jgi:hypothetical protein